MTGKKEQEVQAPQAQAFSIDALASIYASKVDEATVIVEKLTTLRGTMAEWKTKGTEAARATVLDVFLPMALDGADQVEGHENVLMAFYVDPGMTIGTYIDEVQQYLLDCQEFGNEVMTAWLKDHAPNDTETAALRSRLDALQAECDGFRTVIGQLSPDTVLAEFPVAPKGSSGRVSSGGSKTSNVTFWRTKNGEKKPQSDNQHSLSSMAFYHFGKCGVDTLRAAIEKQHGKVDETKTWEGDVTVEYGGATYGWHIGWDVAETV